MRITSAQFKALAPGKKISKKNLERLEEGLDIIPLEDQEAEALNLRFIGLLVDPDGSDPGILEFSHLPNETRTPFKKVISKLKRMGVRKGVPDYLIAIRNTLGEESLVFVELKRIEGGTKSPEQRRFISILARIENVAAHFANGCEEAFEIVNNYIFVT